jgi:hypothetical protein
MPNSKTVDLAPIEIDPQVMRAGLKHALTRSGDTVLCVIGRASIRFIGISGLRMMVSWEHPFTGPRSPRFYVFPRFAVHLLSSMLGQELTGLTLATVGPQAIMGMSDERGHYELRWQADLRQFMVPPEFSQMLAIPKAMITTTYLSLSDAAHQAVANLVNLQSMYDIPEEKLAILVDFGASHLTLDGRTIVHGISGAFYFDPRLIIRALELIKANTLQIGMAPLSLGHRAVLTLLAEQENWHVQCALLSVGLDTQRLYPLPPERLAATQSQ